MNETPASEPRLGLGEVEGQEVGGKSPKKNHGAWEVTVEATWLRLLMSGGKRLEFN